ncbi:MAG: WecB/TagA/CpsF family glycosyltransferase [Candidatus Hydrogenedentales bacterium]
MDTVELFDMRFSRVTFPELCEQLDRRILSRNPGYICTPNVDHICQFHRKAAYREDYREAYKRAWMVVADGVPVLWASRLFGKRLPAKLSGSDLVLSLSGHAASKGHSVYFLGAAEGVAAAAAERLRERYPGLHVSGAYSPVYGFYADEAESSRVAARVREAGPDLCFLALGGPHQEIWMSKYAAACNAPVMIGIGGSFDLVTGRVKRAPVWMQRCGLEWVWRLCQEPKRLWRRYLVDDLFIFVLLFRELGRLLGRVFRP